MSEPKTLYLVQAHPAFSTAFTDSIWDSREDAEARIKCLRAEDEKLGLDWDEWAINETVVNAVIEL